MAKSLVYELYPPAWPEGITQMAEFLPNVARLGSDYVWLAPVYPSPRADHGYDISDYCDVDGRLGTMAELDAFIARAHELGLKVLMDLVLNHTSTAHPWFYSKRDYYCWSNHEKPEWHNLFDGESAWAWQGGCGLCYCHLFCEEQADLNWFPNGSDINAELVREFREIVKFWLLEHSVDGFRLDVPQSINKDFQRDKLELNDLLWGEKSVQVVNAIFTGDDAPVTRSGEKPFLMMELLDPTYGDIVKMYAEKAPVVDFCLNILLKDLADASAEEFYAAIRKSCNLSNFMLDLESHDSPRFASRWLQWGKLSSPGVLVSSNPQGICLYQGQELMLRNPSKKLLSDKLMLELDAQTKMRHKNGESMAKLRHASRANARVPIPLEQYAMQLQRPMSGLNRFTRMLKTWKGE